ncbi:RHS repeat domain-containing protein, partial [Providencia stuartii]
GQYISPDPIGLLGGLNPYSYVHNPTKFIDPYGLSSFDPFMHGEITDFPKDLHFGQNRIAPNFSSIGSQADPLIAGRPILDVANDIKVGHISPDTFVISYTIDPATGKPVTLNNRGLAAIIESGKYPQHAIYVPYEKVPKHLVKDILDRPPSRSISITQNKDGSGLNKIICCKN